MSTSASDRTRHADHEPHAHTRQRLLEAAGEVFAERGFRAATIREIVERAGANVAAVNYHFGDKEGLYAEILEQSCQGTVDSAEPDPDAPAEERLRALVRRYLSRCLGSEAPAWRAQLVARELMEPTPALQTLVDRVMRPAHEQLAAVVCALSGDRLDEQQAWMCAVSIIAQCVHQKRSQSIIERLGHPLPQGPQALDVLVEHITRFSVAAVQNYL